MADTAGTDKTNDPVLKKVLEQSATDEASHQLLKSALAEPDGYKSAIKTEFDAESNWHHALPKGQTSLSSDEIKELLKNPGLDAQSQGFMHFLQDNFLEIAGTAGHKDKVDSSRVSLNDVAAIGAMNEVSPEKIQAGVKFLQDNFFKLSGFDDKVSADRVSKLMWDHSYLLYPKETQELISDLTSVIKSADQRPQNYYHNNRTKSGLTADDAKTLNPDELSDNLRIQALEKGMFGASTLKLDSKIMSPQAQAQYDEAAQRYKQLKTQGLDKFLSLNHKVN